MSDARPDWRGVLLPDGPPPIDAVKRAASGESVEHDCSLGWPYQHLAIHYLAALATVADLRAKLAEADAETQAARLTLAPAHAMNAKLRDENERLKADQSAWRKGVGLIAAALGENAPPNLSCVRIAHAVFTLDAKVEDAAAENARLAALLGEALGHLGDWSDGGFGQFSDPDGTQAAHADLCERIAEALRGEEEK